MIQQSLSSDKMTQGTFAEYESSDDFHGEEPDAAYPYRSVSKCAVLSLILSIMGLAAFLFPGLLMLPVIGMILGIVGLWRTRKLPDELTGAGVAVAGIIIGTIVFGLAGSRHVYLYATEVPDGYRRISFNDLKLEMSGQDVTDAVRKLDGQRVFVKGYVHPGVSSLGQIEQFVLVPDMQTCCFGGQPKMTDMIEVKIVTGKRVTYSRRKLRLGGILHINDHAKEVAGGLTGGLFELEADHVK